MTLETPDPAPFRDGGATAEEGPRARSNLLHQLSLGGEDQLGGGIAEGEDSEAVELDLSRAEALLTLEFPNWSY